MENPTDLTPQELSALIASRICHDLIGPIGAIVNGLELLEMTGTAPGPELELISDSAFGASARLRFFRIAFGAPGDQMIPRADIAAMLEQIAREGRMSYDWQPDGARSRSEVKLACLGLLCLEAALPRGGSIEVAETHGRWTLTARAERIAVDPGLWAWLEGGGDRVTPVPARIQYLLMPAAAEQAGRQIEAVQQDEALILRF
ncbi:histidine phosphotransferase family protein [Pseudodonghicola flavimaris]|uniref:Histidine phosphotransferase family protein n=1 Tax=Pseudodonghicola flavimaris TaxID=3050036 RepID=A0ABT7F0X0_9RHOB|nr:histidine phosphotransferase family protein [Pseudodonghicola flavimaris]MDK3018242.1 histidine phosphotransferase family protein [Pseudodonghicola flavimaris]